SSVTAHQDTSLAPGAIELILGSSFTTLAPQPTATPTPPARQPVPKLAHSYRGITGNASCRSDTSAFSTTYTPGGCNPTLASPAVRAGHASALVLISVMVNLAVTGRGGRGPAVQEAGRCGIPIDGWWPASTTAAR